MSSELQWIAGVLIATIFILAFLGINSEGKTLKSLSLNAPTLLTSIGIFFTFLGILIGLTNFDVTNINEAVPKLLGGLKLAFLSSVMGLFFSVIFRIVQPSLKRELISDDVAGGDLLNELKAITSGTNAVRDALIGEGDASLSTQMSKLRNDFRDFADKVSEDGSQALIEALEAVIRDFNTKISEQFGENFKQLNEAVAALLEWQQEYKAQVEKLTEAFVETQKGIEMVKESVELIEQSSGKIPAQMESIETAFNKTDERMVSLYEGLSSLSDMQSKAEKAVPFLEEHIQQMTENMKSSIENQTEVIGNELETLKNSSQGLLDFVASLTQTIKESQEKSQQTIEEMLNGFGTGMERILTESLDNSEKFYSSQLKKFHGVLDSLNIGADNVLESTKKVGVEVESIITEFQSQQRETMTSLRNNLESAVEQNSSAMNDQFQKFDEAMQNQMQRSMDKMGQNLVGITELFGNQYKDALTKFTDLMQNMERRP